MPKVNVYNIEGKKIKEQELSQTWFGKDINHDIIHQVIVAQQNNRRERIAHTKGRQDVRGGGKKPWRQKGTGRARHGSIRSPLWRGGGVTFGPQSSRNFSKNINKKMALKALAMILSDRVAHQQFVVVDAFDIKEIKTKNLIRALERLPMKGAKTLLLLSKDEKEIKRAGENNTKAQTYKADSVNASAAIACPWIMISEKGLAEFMKVHKEKS